LRKHRDVPHASPAAMVTEFWMLEDTLGRRPKREEGSYNDRDGCHCERNRERDILVPESDILVPCAWWVKTKFQFKVKI